MTKTNVISGFLGAGKTTLIRKLLKEEFAGQKVVLVENEFGEIGIDGGFLQDAGIEISEINSGCICCTLRGDFQEALKKVLDTYAPERIVIEPSGVGKLSDILKIIRNVEGIELDSYSTVVDAQRCKIYHKNFKEFFDDQIQTASTVILSRTQMISDEKLQEAIDLIRELNPTVRIITTPWDELTGSSIFEAMTLESHGFPKNLGPLEDEDEDEEEEHSHHHHHEDHDHEEHEHCHHDHEHCECDHDHEEHDHCECGHDHDEHDHCECGHDHDEHDHCECGHDHDEHEHCECGHDHEHGETCSCGHHHHHHHEGELDADDVFDSIGLETIRTYDETELREMLEKLPDNIVRAKGIVKDNHDGWLFFDFVPGDAQVRAGSPAYTGLITVIGEHVKEDDMKALFGVK